jgi:transcriptional regulator with XRE-family HTH domain
MPQQPLSASEIGARVRLARERLGRSQEDIARQLGISQNSVQKTENGKVGRSRYVSVLWELVGLDLAELNPAFKPNLPPRPAIGYAGSPLILKRMTETQREAELMRRAFEGAMN